MGSRPMAWGLGVFSRDISVDDLADVPPNGIDAGWYSDQGDNTLSNIARLMDGDPCHYKPYALTVLNLFNQRFSEDAAIRMSFRYCVRSLVRFPAPRDVQTI